MGARLENTQNPVAEVFEISALENVGIEQSDTHGSHRNPTARGNRRWRRRSAFPAQEVSGPNYLAQKRNHSFCSGSDNLDPRLLQTSEQ